MQPNPLPKELPIGTKILCQEIEYTSLSIGRLSGINKIFYYFDTVENNVDKRKTPGSFFPERIIWNEVILKSEDETPVEKSIIKCKWCKKEIDNGMKLCSSENSSCQLYWDALSDRCNLSYIKPEDALEYDRACIKIFIDNRKKNNV